MIAFVLEALGVLNANRLRTALTMLGLVIGVMAVIAIQVTGAGLAGAVTGSLSQVNDNSFLVLPNQRQGNATRARLKFTDVVRAKRDVPNIVEAMPLSNAQRLVSIAHRRARLLIAPESDARFNLTPVRYGRAFSAADIAGAAHVGILTNVAYERLFPDGGDPSGLSMRIGAQRYLIVGVLQKLNGVQADLVRSDVQLPYTTYVHEYSRNGTVFGARLIVADGSQLAAAESATVAFFQQIKAGRVEYQTIDKRTLVRGIGGIIGAVTFLVAVIGAVSLVVAGIGILNIMLVSVAERTREIGIRKAIGATRTQVLLQFFIEALLIAVIGCTIGLVLGITIGALVNQFALVNISGVVPPIPWLRSIAISTGFATIVTLAFGTYPAWRAARLDPIEALRYE